VIIKPPMWYYECSSGRIENEGRYQDGILRRGWGFLTPSLTEFVGWMGKPDGDGCEATFHLAQTKIALGTMDIDAIIAAAGGERGMVARARALAFEKYLAHVLRRWPKMTATVYLGSILCESMESYLKEHGLNAWFERIRSILDPFLAMDRVNIAIDMSSGLDTRMYQGKPGHPGLLVLAWLEAQLAARGRTLYVEGVPTPRPGRGRMLARDYMATVRNWTAAITDNPDHTIDANLLTGGGVRILTGWKNDPTKAQRHNAFDDDPLELFRDMVREGHRPACDARWLREDLGARNWDEYQRMARAALGDVKGGA
jgi:hypothetical protein